MLGHGIRPPPPSFPPSPAQAQSVPSSLPDTPSPYSPPPVHPSLHRSALPPRRQPSSLSSNRHVPQSPPPCPPTHSSTAEARLAHLPLWGCCGLAPVKHPTSHCSRMPSENGPHKGSHNVPHIRGEAVFHWRRRGGSIEPLGQEPPPIRNKSAIGRAPQNQPGNLRGLNGSGGAMREAPEKRGGGSGG